MDFKLTKPLVLASQSPRRQELLRLIQLPFILDIPHTFQEQTGDENSDAEALVLFNAKGKAEEIAKKHPKSLILGVDTIVECEGEILGKPENEQAAQKMLQKLSGKTHRVWTAMFLMDTETQTSEFHVETTEVCFAPMSPAEISAYVATGEPMDKAGAYAIQGIGALHITGIRGDFFNVVGLPLHQLQSLLKRIDPNLKNN